MTLIGRLLPFGIVIAAVAGAVALTAQTTELFVIDPTGSTITLHVGKAGMFGFAGHDHEIVAPVSDGDIVLDRLDAARSRISIRFDAAALKVTGQGEPARDVPEVQRLMLGDRVLDSQRYPLIAFTSRLISVTQRSPGERMTLQVAGDLTLHGVTRRVTAPVNVQLMADRRRADGTAVVRQTEFNIRPVTAGAGTVRVKNEVDVSFSVAARRR